MTPGDAYEELKGWQAAIGSAMGFIALIAAALFNFRLNRRRDQEVRTEEAHSVAAALYGELLLFEGQLAQAASAVANLHLSATDRAIKPSFLDWHYLSEPVLYPALARQLGLLDPAIVLAITAFHAEYQAAKQALPLIVHDPRSGSPHSVVLFLRPAVDALERVQACEERIAAMIGVRDRRPPPDLRAALEVLQLEM